MVNDISIACDLPGNIDDRHCKYRDALNFSPLW